MDDDVYFVTSQQDQSMLPIWHSFMTFFECLININTSRPNTTSNESMSHASETNYGSMSSITIAVSLAIIFTGNNAAECNIDNLRKVDVMLKRDTKLIKVLLLQYTRDCMFLSAN